MRGRARRAKSEVRGPKSEDCLLSNGAQLRVPGPVLEDAALAHVAAQDPLAPQLLEAVYPFTAPAVRPAT